MAIKFILTASKTMQLKEIQDKLDLKDLIQQPDVERMMPGYNGYVLNDAEEVIGLNLSGLELTDKEIAFLWKMPELQALNLSENRLKQVGVPATMQSLRFLDLSENEALTSVTFEKGCSQLEKLHLRECQLKQLNFPAGFTQLMFLEAQRNQLRSFVMQGESPELLFLDLSSNELSVLQLTGDLPQLRYLFLQDGNKVSDLSFLAKAPVLETLNVSGNAITDISPLRHLLGKGIEFKWKNEGNGVLLEECPLTTPPPEMVKEGNAAILNYFQEQDAQGTESIYETKLLIVGEGGAGKTSLCRRLLDGNADLPSESESTKGIDIHRLEFPMPGDKKFRINIWDFGGQEIYHATHQFFLTKRSLYILLDDTRKDHKTVQDEGFKYWLEVIELLGGDSPVLIFQNEKGGRSKAIDMAGIKGRFEHVKDKFSGDLMKKGAVATIKEAIIFQAKQLPHIGEKLPKKWVAIRREIEKMALKKAYISQKDYFEIYKNHLPFNRDKALYLSQFFHDLGIFLHFQEDELLARTVILQNTWATEAVFKVLDDEIVKGALGHFTVEDCARIWSDSIYADKHLELRALMTKFELCYLLRDTTPMTWLAPQLLQPSKPENLKKWEKPGDLVIRYQYQFLPKGMINRLMVRQHRFVNQPELGWKSGVFFEQGTTQLLAQVGIKGDEIILRSHGPERKELMSVISTDLDALNETYSGLAEKVKKMIPCICPTCQTNTNPEFYDYQELIRRRAMDKKTIECRTSFADVSVYELLDGFKMKTMKNQSEATTEKKIFFSYSRHDRAYLDEFLTHLSPLRRSKKIAPWNDHDVLPGEEWDDKIKQELANADIILLLISANFLATDYIWDIEIKNAMARHDRGEAVVVPIFLRPCDWEGMAFSKLNGLPAKGIPVSSYEDRDEAWVKIVQRLKEII